MKLIISIWLAYGLDLLLADPYSWPHPVKMMGNYIKWLMNKLDFQEKSKREQYMFGVFLNLSLLIIVIGLSLFISSLAYRLNDYVGWGFDIYLIYTCFSAKGLAIEANKVKDALASHGLIAGRKQVAMIVGRNTEQLTQEEIIKAVVETVAENTSDGFIAPLCFIILFGPVGGLVYKAINTLDSMIGYKQAPYTYMGCFSAKLDDLANWIPARITWLVMIIASLFIGMDWRKAIEIGVRDSRNHASPNSGFPESVVAGALGIQLGGTHIYHGQEVYKPTIGDANRSPVLSDIQQVNKLLYWTSLISVLIFSFIRLSAK